MSREAFFYHLADQNKGDRHHWGMEHILQGKIYVLAIVGGADFDVSFASRIGGVSIGGVDRSWRDKLIQAEVLATGIKVSTCT